MPHNLFLHSEVIQSRQWHLDKPEIIHRQLKYEYLDTLFSMGQAARAVEELTAQAGELRRVVGELKAG